MSESEHTKTPREAVRRQQPAEPAPQAGGQQDARGQVDHQEMHKRAV